MEILRSIALYTEGRDMPFLVIGGHAVNAYGISRQTADIDLVVPLETKSQWLELMSKLKYSKGQNDDRFARFRPESLANWPIDLMFVDGATFSKLYVDAEEVSFGYAIALIVSVRHLIALKIHALKHYQEHRFTKDYLDIVGLLRTQKSGLTDDDLRQLCERYANRELFEKLKRDVSDL